MLVYLAEGSTPILHTGWMMNAVGLADTKAFKLLTLALLVVFFLVRICVSPLLAYAYLSPANRHLYDGRDGVFAFQLGIVFAFAGLNFFWCVPACLPRSGCVGARLPCMPVVCVCSWLASLWSLHPVAPCSSSATHTRQHTTHHTMNRYYKLVTLVYRKAMGIKTPHSSPQKPKPKSKRT